MNPPGDIVVAIVKIVHLIINIYTFIVLISVILSWVRPNPTNPIVRIIRQITEPVFNQVRRIMPKAMSRTGLDFSPIVVILLLYLIDRVIAKLLMGR